MGLVRVEIFVWVMHELGVTVSDGVKFGLGSWMV